MKFRIRRIVYFYSDRIVFCPMVKKNFWSKWHYIILDNSGFSTCKDSCKSTCFDYEARARRTICDYVSYIYKTEFIKTKSIIIK